MLFLNFPILTDFMHYSNQNFTIKNKNILKHKNLKFPLLEPAT